MKTLVAFFEIPVVDFKRAINFYETVFETNLSIYDCEEEKMAFFSDDAGKCYGAISWAKDFKPSKDGVLISLACEDICKTLSVIELNGGKVHTPKTNIEAEGAGCFSIFIDSEGNRVGLWSEK